MDTSKEYVEMWLASGLEVEPDDYQPWVCPKCFKVYSPLDRPPMKWHWCEDEEKGFVHVDLVPLPRQDQLQGMLSWYWDLLERGEHFHLKLWSCSNGVKFTGGTAEQALIQGAIYIRKQEEGGREDGGSSNCTGGSGSR